MIAFGIILAILGTVGLVCGTSMNNNMSMQMESLFSNGTTNPGSMFVVLGAIALILGIILFIAGIAKRK